MRKLVIQYPDGKYHTVNATKFYGVLVNGKEEYILEYDDLSTSKRNCFTVLDREGNNFVKRPLASQAEYSLLAARIRFMKKKLYNLEVLPGKIGLCKAALEVLKPFAAPVVSQPVPAVAAGGSPPPPSSNPPKKNNIVNEDAQVNVRKTIIVYEDISLNRDMFPYYITGSAAKVLGWGKSLYGYHHLTPTQLEILKNNFDILYKKIYLGYGTFKESITVYVDFSRVGYSNYFLDEETAKRLGFTNIVCGFCSLTNEDLDKLKQKYNVHYISLVQVKTNIVVNVYKDVGTQAEEFPYYLDAQIVNALKLSNGSGYYHLSPAQLVYLETNYGVIYRTINLDIQKVPINNGSIEDTEVVASGPLTEQETQRLNELFDKLMDFEDYYSYFGIEDLRNTSEQQILNDSRIKELSNLIKRGVACKNEIAINLSEFLEGFKNSIKGKSLKK